MQNVRRYTLKVAKTIDETGRVETVGEIPLTEEDMSDLGSLIGRLPDDRYRIYLTYENGLEILVRDFYVHNGKPLVIEESVPIESNAKVETPMELTDEDELSATDGESRESSAEQDGLQDPSNNASSASVLGIPFVWSSFRRAARRLRAKTSSNEPLSKVGK